MVLALGFWVLNGGRVVHDARYSIKPSFTGSREFEVASVVPDLVETQSDWSGFGSAPGCEAVTGTFPTRTDTAHIGWIAAGWPFKCWSGDFTMLLYQDRKPDYVTVQTSGLVRLPAFSSMMSDWANDVIPAPGVGGGGRTSVPPYSWEIPGLAPIRPAWGGLLGNAGTAFLLVILIEGIGRGLAYIVQHRRNHCCGRCAHVLLADQRKCPECGLDLGPGGPPQDD